MYLHSSYLVGILGILYLATIAPTLGAHHHHSHDRCKEKSFEQCEEMANVIFTGTVRDLQLDNFHPAMKKAKVEVKRIIKGKNVINTLPGINPSDNPWVRKYVMVDGIDDPHICESHVKKYDTRIFLLNKGENGELKLNSSIIRMSINTIERADAAVKDVPFVPRPTPPQAPCETKFCPFGAQCFVNEKTNTAYCQCEEQCSNVFAPVCGSDGVTYISECHLRAASCSQKKRIRVRSQGSCDVKDPCKEMQCRFGAQCVPSLDGLKARCQCSEKCDTYGDSVDSTPVCGTDGQDYPNLCHVRRAACRQMKEIRVKLKGKCDPCDGFRCESAQVCQLDEQRTPVCRCNTLCDLEFSPVCGSDGSTYSNDCIMRVAACKARKHIRVLFRGECTQGNTIDGIAGDEYISSGNNPCKQLSCEPREECRVDRQGIASCTCPPPCEAVLRPVCGSDGVTYDSECKLRRQSCLNKKVITVMFIGQCSKDGPCTKHPCEFDGICVVKNGLPTCQCPVCTDEFEPVCGSNDVPYHNECKLKQAACELRKTIAIRHKGLCDVCDKKKCKFYAICDSDGEGGSKCVCPTTCVQVRNEVCGSDGKTYTNECELHVTSCREKQEIKIASYGPCDLCVNVKCRFGARCENGKCVCPQNCRDINEPVCANDGQTYTNVCEMRRHACDQGVEIEVVHNSECPDVGSGSGVGSGVDVCDETTCGFGGTCEYDAEGNAGCICNFNCEAIRSSVCGSDGRTHGNECQLREESCRRQIELTIQPMDNCEDIDQGVCDGNAPLKNSATGREIDCSSGKDTCPAGSYCHRHVTKSRCCKEEQPIKSCADTKYGCCPDKHTASPGANNAGCPSVCHCNPLGSFGLTCDPRTRQCTCKPGVGGLRCDRCEPGFWGLPMIAEGNSGCTPCGCNIFGSVRDDCEQMTGECVCKPGVSGPKCDVCSNGKHIGPQGCSDTDLLVRSCSDLQCSFGSVCLMKDGRPTCECPSGCAVHNTDTMVCGSDGQSYGSECALKLFACRLQKDIKVAYKGTCKEMTATTPMTPSGHRPGKTTRHLHGKPEPTPSVPDYGTIGQFCRRDRDCVVEHSTCTKSNICSCDAGFMATTDNRHCQESPITSPALTIPPPTTTLPTTISSTTVAPTTTKEEYPMLSDQGEVSYQVPSFSGMSYLQLSGLRKAHQNLTIDMTFRTNKKNGVLFYSAQSDDGKGDFVSLSVNGAHVEFRFDLGSGSAVLRSQKPVSLNKFHRIVARRFGKDGLLGVDDQSQVTGTSRGSLQSLNLHTAVYIGSIPQAKKAVHDNIGVEEGLVGCIEKLTVITTATKQYSLTYPSSPDVLGGFGIEECGDNPCTSMPCINGGTCIRVDDENFKCDCPAGLSGKVCQDGTTAGADAKGCRPNPCQAGGTCVGVGDSFICTCPADRDGDQCQNEKHGDITIPEFLGHSYLEVKTMKKVGRSLSYEVWFLAKDNNGVILYSAQEKKPKGDFISLNLVNGYLQFRFDLGSGIANITSPSKVAMNIWHRVEVARTNRQATMVIDSEEPIRGQSKGSLTELNLPQKLFIGGFPGTFHPDSGITNDFQGAIQRIYEDGSLVENMVQTAMDTKDVTQYEGPPCASYQNPCQNGGTCIPKLNEYECKCPQGRMGRKCELEAKMLDTDRPLKFDGQVHHTYRNKIKRSQTSQKNNLFEIKFRTTARDGLLLLMTKSTSIDGDYLAIALNKGHVEVSYNLGKQTAKTLLYIRSDTRVSDDHWHTLKFSREKRKGSLSVDGEKAMHMVSEQGATQLDTDGVLWLGGSRSTPRGLPAGYYSGFIGCIEELKVDGKVADLVTARTDHTALAYCDV